MINKKLRFYRLFLKLQILSKMGWVQFKLLTQIKHRIVAVIDIILKVLILRRI